MSNDDVGYLVRLKSNASFTKRRSRGSSYYPLRSAVFRVFREEVSIYAGTKLYWIESMDKTAEACVKETQLLKLSPLEQLALQVKDD